MTFNAHSSTQLFALRNYISSARILRYILSLMELIQLRDFLAIAAQCTSTILLMLLICYIVPMPSQDVIIFSSVILNGLERDEHPDVLLLTTQILKI